MTYSEKKKLSNKEIIVTAKDNGNGHKVIKNVELTVLADWTLELMIGYMIMIGNMEERAEVCREDEYLVLTYFRQLWCIYMENVVSRLQERGKYEFRRC